MRVWVGGSAGDVKQLQAVLPTKNLTLTLFQPLPGLFLDLFVQTLLASYGSFGQRQRWTPIASYGAEWVKLIIIRFGRQVVHVQQKKPFLFVACQVCDDFWDGTRF